MLPGVNVTSIPLNGEVAPFPGGTLVSYKLIKLSPCVFSCLAFGLTQSCLQAMLPGLNVTSIPLNGEVAPSPRGTLAPAMSYKLMKLDQTAPKDGSDPAPKFMLAGQDANEPLLPPGPSKHMRNRKVCHLQWTGFD